MITHVMEFGAQGAGQLSGRVQMVHKYKLLCSKTDVGERDPLIENRISSTL